MHRSLLFVALAFAVATPALAAPSTPDALGSAFCVAMTDGTADPLDLLTPSLNEAIEVAMARNAELQAAAPDEKPPLGDGVPWSSWPDKPDTCETEVTEAYDGAAMVNVTYGFAGAPEATYTDTLILLQQGEVWALDDIVLTDNLTLRGLLESAFEP